VPAGPAGAPRAFPGRLARLGLLPEGVQMLKFIGKK
jgi:hypothetical protein